MKFFNCLVESCPSSWRSLARSVCVESCRQKSCNACSFRKRTGLGSVFVRSARFPRAVCGGGRVLSKELNSIREILADSFIKFIGCVHPYRRCVLETCGQTDRVGFAVPH